MVVEGFLPCGLALGYGESVEQTWFDWVYESWRKGGKKKLSEAPERNQTDEGAPSAGRVNRWRC